ncbi:hypothetical protein JS756_19995 [Streptomyces actuosus]|uniref:Tat pathway signal sequence domain protein n=1 Tax=Streptomyces actuosus TaxID=1885 RepID=A0ABS2VTD0_STRAS|nr:hypothetical protein [Streptomyces actuosus]
MTTAITGERPPAGADAAFLAEHRAAETDVALLRRQLTALGDALADAAPSVPSAHSAPTGTASPVEPTGVEPPSAERSRPAPSPSGPAPAAPRVPVRRPRRRLLAAALGLAAAAAGVTVAGSLVVPAVNDAAREHGSAADAKAAAPPVGLADPAYVACAALVVEGDVTGVTPVAGTAERRVTLRVTRAYAPRRQAGDTGPGQSAAPGQGTGPGRDVPTVVVTVGQEVAPAPRTGQHVLVGVRRHAATADVWITGEAAVAPERAPLTEAVNRARDVVCD